MPPFNPEHYVCIHLWDGAIVATKVAFLNKETGAIRPLTIGGEKQHFPFIKLEEVRKLKFQVLMGKKRTAFLSKFGLMVDPTSRTIRRKKK